MLVSIEVDDAVRAGDKGVIWIVNDLYKGYSDVKLIYWLEDGNGNRLNQRQTTMNVEPDSVINTGYTFEFKGCPAGKYTVHAEVLTKEGNLLSKNQEEIIVTK
jgi:hypothetical protein